MSFWEVFKGIPPHWVGVERYGILGLFRRKRDKWGDTILVPGWVQVVGDPRPSILDEIANSMAHDRCYFCGEKQLMEGPRGCGAVNVVCAACGAKFNDAGMFTDLLRGPTNPIPERILGQEGRAATRHPDMSGIDLEELTL